MLRHFLTYCPESLRHVLAHACDPLRELLPHRGEPLRHLDAQLGHLLGEASFEPVCGDGNHVSRPYAAGLFDKIDETGGGFLTEAFTEVWCYTRGVHIDHLSARPLFDDDGIVAREKQ